MNRRQRQQGFALIHGIGFITLVTIVVAVVTQFQLTQLSLTHSRIHGDRARYAAEAGLAAAVAELQRGGAPPLELAGELGSASYRVRLEPLAGGRCRVEALGVSAHASRRLEAVVEPGPGGPRLRSRW